MFTDGDERSKAISKDHQAQPYLSQARFFVFQTIRLAVPPTLTQRDPQIDVRSLKHTIIRRMISGWPQGFLNHCSPLSISVSVGGVQSITSATRPILAEADPSSAALGVLPTCSDLFLTPIQPLWRQQKHGNRSMSLTGLPIFYP